MQIQAQVLNARTQTSQKGDRYQIITLIDRDGVSPLEHMLQYSTREDSAQFKNEEIKGKQVVINCHKIEQFAGEIRVQGSIQLAKP